jgi:hypothetical protein
VIVTLLLVAVSGLAKAVQDTLTFHFSSSVFKNLPAWNPILSWKNKWKNGDPLQGERFWGSSTVFVFVTDAWHLAQFFRINLLFASMIFLPIDNILYTVLIARVLFSVSFELGFRALVK